MPGETALEIVRRRGQRLRQSPSQAPRAAGPSDALLTQCHGGIGIRGKASDRSGAPDHPVWTKIWDWSNMKQDRLLTIHPPPVRCVAESSPTGRLELKTHALTPHSTSVPLFDPTHRLAHLPAPSCRALATTHNIPQPVGLLAVATAGKNECGLAPRSRPCSMKKTALRIHSSSAPCAPTPRSRVSSPSPSALIGSSLVGRSQATSPSHGGLPSHRRYRARNRQLPGGNRARSRR